MNVCDLCSAYGTPIINKKFYIVECRSCNVPMVVLKEHRNFVTKEEIKRLEEFRKERFPEKRYRGYMRKIPEHWHDHLI